MNRELNWLVVLGLAVLTPAAHADIFTLNQSRCCGTGPFGSVSVVQGIDGNTVNVSLILNAGEVYAKNRAGDALGFRLDKSFALDAITTGFSLHTDIDRFRPYGRFADYIVCDICAAGTSSEISTPLNFTLTSSTGLTPADFIENRRGFFFAADIGVPDGRRRYDTGNAAATVRTPSAVPEPGSLVLLFTAAGAAFMLKKRVPA